jgi:hypothetical protein
MYDKEGLSSKKIWAIASVVVGIILAIILTTNCFEYLDARQVMVIQFPSGKLSACTEPGIYGQWFGSVTKYPLRTQFWFSVAADQGKEKDESVPIQFGDGGHAKISGSLAWEMPKAKPSIIQLHKEYGSPEAIQQQLIRTATEKSIYMSGPLMTSKESYAERRNELLNVIDDQLRLGVFKTETREEKQKDPITGQEKSVKIVTILKDKDNTYMRQDKSPIQQYSIGIFNLSINKVIYDGAVEAQIKAQQDLAMQVQTSMAQARQAEQQALTAEKNGQAEAAKAKWEQEVIKAKEVTAAEQRKAVALLDVQTADARKREQTLLGEGEGARRRAVMVADGALAQKLEALVKMNEQNAAAIKDYKGNWVPGVIMGQGGGQQSNAAVSLLELMGVKAARDLGLDMSIPKNAGSK